MRDWAVLAGFLVLCFAVAGVGGMWTASSVGPWYQALQKPPFNPPGWVFGPVWTVLYAMMAVAAWLVWRKAGFAGAAVPLAVFAVQLALNLAWSGLFFGLRQLGWAFADIVLLWIAIAATIAAFACVSAPAAWLIAPYLAWVSFASLLNFRIWTLNR
jgi:tryptophan-rich sensory protein